jgi:2-succinyl-6-hydroxy-2,4-cyclohexadiene-1-carboxylate synthase
MLPNLKMPVLCIAGEYDYKFRAIARQMCTKLPDGRLSIIPGAGHAAHIERPREFNRDVLAFLRESRNVVTDSKLARTRSRSHHRV